jgi:PHS family inorganic phosphate transporter-like MFS transporter
MAPILHKTAGGNAAYHSKSHGAISLARRTSLLTRDPDFHNDFAHIQDPNERRRLALAEIDKAPFGWYHVRVGDPPPCSGPRSGR